MKKSGRPSSGISWVKERPQTSPARLELLSPITITALRKWDVEKRCGDGQCPVPHQSDRWLGMGLTPKARPRETARETVSEIGLLRTPVSEERSRKQIQADWNANRRGHEHGTKIHAGCCNSRERKCFRFDARWPEKLRRSRNTSLG